MITARTEVCICRVSVCFHKQKLRSSTFDESTVSLPFHSIHCMQLSSADSHLEVWAEIEWRLLLHSMTLNQFLQTFAVVWEWDTNTAAGSNRYPVHCTNSNKRTHTMHRQTIHCTHTALVKALQSLSTLHTSNAMMRAQQNE